MAGQPAAHPPAPSPGIASRPGFDAAARARPPYGYADRDPGGRQDIDGELCCLTNSGWRHNFQGGRECELVLDGRVRAARGALVADVGSVVRAYREVMDRVGPGGYRRTGLKVNIDRPPNDAELTEAVLRYGLAYVRFTLLD